MSSGNLADVECRVLTYSHDGFGMGHLRRNINVTTRFLADAPESSVLMLVGCSPESYFELPAGIDFIKLPSIVKVATGVHQLSSLRIGQLQAEALRNSLIKRVADVYRPDLLLVDYVPAGVWGELLPTLRMLKQRKDAPVMMLGMREIIDAPDVVREHWRREGTYEVINRYYDAVVVYGCPDVFDTVREYGLDRELTIPIRYCGYVCSEETIRPSEQMREELLVGEGDRLVVVTGGGGRDAYPMMRTCIQALGLVRKELPLTGVLIAGPLMGSSQKESLREEARAAGVRFLNYVCGNLSYLNAADLVITMAGYNSLAEVLRLKKKALVIPRLGPSAEQTTRSELFARRGLIDTLSPRCLSPEQLAARIHLDLERDDFPVEDPLIDLDGARQAAAHLAALNRDRAVAAHEDHGSAVFPTRGGMTVPRPGQERIDLVHPTMGSISEPLTAEAAVLSRPIVKHNRSGRHG